MYTPNRYPSSFLHLQNDDSDDKDRLPGDSDDNAYADYSSEQTYDFFAGCIVSF